MSDDLREKARRIVDAYDKTRVLFEHLAGEDAAIVAICRDYLAETEPESKLSEPINPYFVSEAVDWSGYRHPNWPLAIDAKDILLLLCNHRSISKGLFLWICRECGVATKVVP